MAITFDFYAFEDQREEDKKDKWVEFVLPYIGKFFIKHHDHLVKNKKGDIKGVLASIDINVDASRTLRKEIDAVLNGGLPPTLKFKLIKIGEKLQEDLGCVDIDVKDEVGTLLSNTK